MAKTIVTVNGKTFMTYQTTLGTVNGKPALLCDSKWGKDEFRGYIPLHSIDEPEQENKSFCFICKEWHSAPFIHPFEEKKN